MKFCKFGHVLLVDSRANLYSALEYAMEIVQICENNSIENQALEEAIRALPPRGNRTYIEAGSDIYVRVCRFLFADDTRHNISRYAVALRKAGSQNLKWFELRQYLIQKGGINSLTKYNRRIGNCPHCGGKL